MTEFNNQTEQGSQEYNTNGYSGQGPVPNSAQGQYQSNYNSNQVPENGPMPANSMVLAIVATVLNTFACCSFYIGILGIILGIIGIVFASQVNSKYNSGDYYGALASAKNAKILSYISLAIAVIGIVILIVLVAIVGTSPAFIEEFQRQMEMQGH